MWKLIAVGVLVVITTGSKTHGHSAHSPCWASIEDMSDMAVSLTVSMPTHLDSMMKSVDQSREALRLTKSDPIQKCLNGSQDPDELREAVGIMGRALKLSAEASMTRQEIIVALSDNIAAQMEIMSKRVVPDCLSDKR